MKMKLYSVSFALIAFCSCKKMIKEKPQGFVNSQTIFATESGAEAALVGCYSHLSTYYYFGIGYEQFLSEGSGTFWTNQAAALPVAHLAALSTDALVNNTWRESYATINSVNSLIDGMEGSNITPAVKNQVLGEGYFLRAVVYFNNVRTWGAVPLWLHAPSSTQPYMARTSEDSVYNQVISDLQQAEKLLPVPGGQAVGHPHKWAAYSLLAKVYMTLAGNDQSSPYWQKAYDEAIQVYNSKAYSLVLPFKDLWDV
ncbi:MAG TPA: RagB/SusD family nutrient uptake outer membrane protein, partial [Puia sp.]|nr:RagB/SusD family nutrient uptake outer membrane protein [Puia sp.]